MKSSNFFLISIIAWLSHDVFAQHFEIPIYFEDTAGHKDTVVLGYDPLASYAIDTSFGEINILNSSYHNDFEVRAAIYDYNLWPELPRILESKQMIVGDVCSHPSSTGEGNAIMVVIKSQNWPITIRWNNALFQEDCNFIDIIDCTPGGWFDVCGGGHPHLIFEMRLTDTVSYYDTEFKIETEHDTLGALFFRFYTDFGSGVENTTEGSFTVFPNPTFGFITLNRPLNANERISVTDIMGRPVTFNLMNQGVDLSGAPDGMYIVTVKLHTGESAANKVIKKSS